MDFNFELFEEGQVERTRERVHVTLNKECKMFFKALGRPDGVALMYDRRRKAIGVMPSALNRKHAYRLRRKDRGSQSRVITARNFCRHYAICPAETIGFPTAKVDKNGVLILDLHAAEKVKGANVKR
jgi:hypothetical protein